MPGMQTMMRALPALFATASPAAGACLSRPPRLPAALRAPASSLESGAVQNQMFEQANRGLRLGHKGVVLRREGAPAWTTGEQLVHRSTLSNYYCYCVSLFSSSLLLFFILFYSKGSQLGTPVDGIPHAVVVPVEVFDAILAGRELGGATRLTLLVLYGLVCFLRHYLSYTGN